MVNVVSVAPNENSFKVYDLFPMNEEESSNENTVKLWLKRLGLAGFLFFLIKGLAWIGIALIAYYTAKK